VGERVCERDSDGEREREYRYSLRVRKIDTLAPTAGVDANAGVTVTTCPK